MRLTKKRVSLNNDTAKTILVQQLLIQCPQEKQSRFYANKNKFHNKIFLKINNANEKKKYFSNGFRDDIVKENMFTQLTKLYTVKNFRLQKQSYILISKNIARFFEKFFKTVLINILNYFLLSYNKIKFLDSDYINIEQKNNFKLHKTFQKVQNTLNRQKNIIKLKNIVQFSVIIISSFYYKLNRTKNLINTIQLNDCAKFYNCILQQILQKLKRNFLGSQLFPKKNFISTIALILVFLTFHITTTYSHNTKYSLNVIKTKYGPLRGIIVRGKPIVEAFLGVPYASPPVGSLRYMPPVTPSTWHETKLAERFSAVCPQAVPVTPPGPEALLELPRGRLAQLRRILPLLTNQSEDCLYLNLYVPRYKYPQSQPNNMEGFEGNDQTGSSTRLNPSHNSSESTHNKGNFFRDKLLATIVYIHGESYEWNSGNPYDGSVLAAHGQVIVVTINFRLGILGFLKTGGKGSAQGNFGLMDLVAGLHWLRENLPSFGGDPNRITIMGHKTGAALANILIVSPVSKDLVHRAILLSGSALSPWAIQKEPLIVKRRVAEQTGCHGDLIDDDMAPCLRTKSLQELLAVKIDSPRFLPGFAPFVDGTVLVHSSSNIGGPLTLPIGSAIASTNGVELADFPSQELLFGLTTIESYLDLSAQDLEFGFNETRKDRIFRTFVRNVFSFHLNEIYAALKNEYTDWERSVRNLMGCRDSLLEFLSDGHTASPLIRLGYLHSIRGGRSYFFHFQHQSGERDFPQRAGSVHGEDVPFCLGLPISALFPYNYTKEDIKISRQLVRYISNFAQTGNPNEKHKQNNISQKNQNSLPLISASLIKLNENLNKSDINQNYSKSNVKLIETNNFDSNQSFPIQLLNSKIELRRRSNISRTILNSMISSSNNSGVFSFQSKRPAYAPYRRKRKSERNQYFLNISLETKQSDISFNSNIYNQVYSKKVKRTIESEEEEEDESDQIYDDKTKDDDYHNTNDYSEEEQVRNYDRFTEPDNSPLPFWDSYDGVNQLYLEIGNKAVIRNHYRGHKLSMWLSLIPQLHSPSDIDELPLRHHHFLEDSAQYYDGMIRQQISKKPVTRKTNTQQQYPLYKTSNQMTDLTIMGANSSKDFQVISSTSTTTQECSPNITVIPTIAATRPQNHQPHGNGAPVIMAGPNPGNSIKQDNNNLLRRLTNGTYQSYTTALTVTISVGGFLLFLNILIFAGIYYQREKRATDTKKKAELREAETRYSEATHSDKLESFLNDKSSRKSSLRSLTMNFGEYSCYDEKLRCKEKPVLADVCSIELPLKEYNCKNSPVQSHLGSLKKVLISEDPVAIQSYPSNYGLSTHGNIVMYQQFQVKSHSNQSTTMEFCNQATQSEQPMVHDVGTSANEYSNDNIIVPITSTSLKSTHVPQTGILRQPGPPTTPGSNKKRVQIQEISV